MIKVFVLSMCGCQKATEIRGWYLGVVTPRLQAMPKGERSQNRTEASAVRFVYLKGNETHPKVCLMLRT